jgi:hypothetical protein
MPAHEGAPNRASFWDRLQEEAMKKSITPNRYNLSLVLICLLLLAMTFILGCFKPPADITTTETTTVYGSSPTITLPPIDVPIMTDSFILDRLDEENANKLSEPPYPLPFNEYGLYYSDFFFVHSDERVNVTMTSECPISVYFSRDEFVGGITLILNYRETRERLDYAHLESSELTKMDGTWEAKATFTTSSSAFCLLFLINDSGEPAVCQYTISLSKE